MSTENTSKGKKSKATKASDGSDSRPHSQPVSMTPLIVEQGLYCVEQIIAALAISPNTLDGMVDDGMRVAKRRSKRRFFWGRDVMEFLVSENGSD